MTLHHATTKMISDKTDEKYPFLIFFIVNKTQRQSLFPEFFHTSQSPVKYPNEQNANE